MDPSPLPDSTFLEDVAFQLVKEHGEKVSDLILVVPNKRAVIFLKQALAKAAAQVIWAPQIVPVQQFIEESSPWTFLDPLSLVLELYEAYSLEAREVDPTWDEPLDQFFSWGDILVRDFDEVDKYLIPAEKLFTNIRELREIDAFFSLSEEDKAALEQLWQALRGKQTERGLMEARYLQMWELLHNTYLRYRNRLSDQGLAYEGMAYRALAERLQEGEAAHGEKHHVFIGFNALLKAEEAILGALLAQGKATVFWDVHPWYFGEGQLSLGSEPGKFIRSYHQTWSGQGLDSRLIVARQVPNQRIRLVGAPQNIGQARYLGLALQDLEQSWKAQQPETSSPRLPWSRQAVVLSDEKMLFPALEVLPATAQFPNVTMGYPLRQTHVFHLFSLLLEAMKVRQWDSAQGWVLPAELGQRMLLHPWVQAHFKESRTILEDMVKRSQLLLPLKTVEAAPNKPDFLLAILAMLGRPAQAGWVEIVADLDQVLSHLLDRQGNQEELDQAFLLRLREAMLVVAQTLSRHEVQIRPQSLLRLLAQALQGIRLPFLGEPLMGLQVMGFLETRGLDFERVLILGANEGQLPDTSTGNSFVPYLLRKAFGMPTFEEKDAIYAYHFFRFLQRAKVVELIYNRLPPEGEGGKEMSRFLQQIGYFLREEPEVIVEEIEATVEAPVQVNPEIRIPNGDTIRQKLQQRFGQGSGLSASSLNTYRTCSLKFFFQYLAGLKAQEGLSTAMPANQFGTLLHRTLELAYEQFAPDYDIRETDILAQLPNLPACLERAIEEEGIDNSYLAQGENVLKRQALLQQSEELLRRDAAQAPFRVLGLEKKLHLPGGLKPANLNLVLSGSLDRVEYNRLGHQILDYKTGKVEIKKELPDPEWVHLPENNQQFQGYLYALLYLKNHPEVESVRVGFYPLKQLGKGVEYLDGGSAISQQQVGAFEQELIRLANRIATEEFTQTETLTACAICDFRGICQRDQGD